MLGAAALHDGTRQMGELVVITASSSVARWAQRAAHVQGPVGTSLRLSPLVLLLDEKLAGKLLDPAAPELALCAAWAMHDRHDAQAESIVDRAMEVNEALPEPLRTSQLHAILGVLSKQLRARLEQAMINPDHIHESPTIRRLRLRLEAAGEKRGRAEGEAAGRAEGEAAGLAKAVLTVLETRGLPLTDADHARIRECADIAQLDAWLRRAATASSAAEVLSTGPSAAKNGTAKNGKAHADSGGAATHAKRPARKRKVDK
jgi:hypothetical protein